MLLPLALLALLSVGANAQTVCFTGYIIDNYCIKRGRLFDNPSLSTLENPQSHSVHCLVDVAQCVHSDYEVLTQTADSSGKYCRVYKLDSAGKDMAVALARSEGVCGTCTGAGDLVQGFRATIVGTPTGSGAPVPLQVSQVLPASTGCGGFGGETVPTEFNCNQGEQVPLIYAHGSLMLSSWGFLLPAGVIIARFLKHREGALWFQAHRALQITGIVLSFTGWVIALSQFDVFFSSADKSFTKMYSHGVIGCVVMSLGLLQPLNALLRPHPPEPGQSKPTLRLVWEILHKSSGYVAVCLAFFVIILGTTFVPAPDDQTNFQIGLGCAAGLLVVLLVGMLVDKKHYNQDKGQKSTESDGTELRDVASAPATPELSSDKP